MSFLLETRTSTSKTRSHDDAFNP